MEFVFGKDVCRRLHVDFVDHLIEVLLFLVNKTDRKYTFKFFISCIFVAFVAKRFRRFNCQDTELRIMIEKFVEAEIIKFRNIKYQSQVVVRLDIEYLIY